MPELFEEVPVLLVDPEQLGNLADHNRQRQADDEALEHRLGDEVRKKSQPEQSREQREDAGHDCERHGERDDVVRARREIRDRRRGQGRSRRHRSHDQVPGTAERGVQQQRAGRRVKPDHRRHTGDRGVRQRFGNEHCPHRETGDRVGAQPPPLVMRERIEDQAPPARLLPHHQRWITQSGATKIKPDAPMNPLSSSILEQRTLDRDHVTVLLRAFGADLELIDEHRFAAASSTSATTFDNDGGNRTLRAMPRMPDHGRRLQVAQIARSSLSAQRGSSAQNDQRRAAVRSYSVG